MEPSAEGTILMTLRSFTSSEATHSTQQTLSTFLSGGRRFFRKMSDPAMRAAQTASQTK